MNDGKITFLYNNFILFSFLSEVKMKQKDDKGYLKVISTHIYKIFLFCIFTLLMIGCESDWYPIYEDWLCTINVDGSDLEYIRNSYGNFLLSPDRQTLIEYTKNKFYLVNINDLSPQTLLIDFGDDQSAIDQPGLSNNSIVYNYHGDIYIYDFADADTSRIASAVGSTPLTSLTISDDGTQIAYTIISDSLSSIILIHTNRRDRSVIFETENTDSLKTYIDNVHLINNWNKSKFIIFSLHSYSKTFYDGIYYIDSGGTGCPFLIVKDIYPNHLTISDDKDYVLYNINGIIQKVSIDSAGITVLDETVNEFFLRMDSKYFMPKKIIRTLSVLMEQININLLII